MSRIIDYKDAPNKATDPHFRAMMMQAHDKTLAFIIATASYLPCFRAAEEENRRRLILESEPLVPSSATMRLQQFR